MAYIAPKAPHIQDGAGYPITIPAPWYQDEFPGVIAPRTPSWNYSAVDHHWMIAQQQPMTMEEADHSDLLYRARWQALMSVDDIVEDITGTLHSYTHTLYTHTPIHCTPCTLRSGGECWRYGAYVLHFHVGPRL
jgi:hypothetical protein